MGCSSFSKVVWEEKQQIKDAALEFKRQLILEVQEEQLHAQRRLKTSTTSNSQNGTLPRRSSTDQEFGLPTILTSASADDNNATRLSTLPGPSCSSLRFDGNRHSASGSVGLKPLRNSGHLSRESVLGSQPLESGGNLMVRVPGKVGCEDDKVFVEDSSRMLLRTRKVHRHTRSVKKVYALRSSSNNETCDEHVSPENESSTLPEDERCLVVKVLQQHFLFSSLQADEQKMLAAQMLRLEKKKGEVICTKGEKGNACYILISGVCSVRSDGLQVAVLSAGHTFGEHAMLYDALRSATIVCAAPRVVLSMIRGSTFRQCLTRSKERTLHQTFSFLNTHDTFSKLTVQERRMFAQALSPQTFDRGALLIDENVSGAAELMFLVKEGSVEITDQYRNRTVLSEGAAISGKKLPYGHKVVEAKAVSRVECLSISKNVLNRLFGNIGQVLRLATVRSFLESTTFFKELAYSQQLAVAALFQDQHFDRGQVIVTAMSDPQLVLVIEGEVAILDPDQGDAKIPKEYFDKVCTAKVCNPGYIISEPEWELPHSLSACTSASMHRGDVFGEDAFTKNGFMTRLLVTRSEAVVCRVGHDEVCRALRGHAAKTPPLSWILYRNQLKLQLQATFPFSAIYEEMLDILVEAFNRVEYNPNERITRKGGKARCFCLIVEGEAVQLDGQSMEPLMKGSCFGARELLLNVPMKVDIMAAATGCSVMVLQRDKFVDACGVLFKELGQKMKYKELKIEASDVVQRELLGQGQFGVVHKVNILGPINEDFALKRMSKRKVVELEQGKSVALEREILDEFCHPLIVRLVTTFQDSHSVCLLMETIAGGDLFTAIRQIGDLSEEQVLFYGASLVLALEYVHSRGIVYRDLKPENVMLQNSGFVKLVDFGCCSRKLRSYTFIGTPEYMAPEVISGRGYGKPVDWWSFGIIMYELICGPLPFGEGMSDPLDVFREILEKPLAIPAKATPEEADLLTSLLERMPEQRLGSSTVHSENEVRQHPFFELLQWDAILEQSTMPPYVPCQEEAPTPATPDMLRIMEDDQPPDPQMDLSCFAGF